MAKSLNTGGIDRMAAGAHVAPPARPDGEHSTQAPAAPTTQTPPAPAAEGTAPAPAAATEHAAPPAPALSGLTGAAQVGAEPDVYRPGGEHSFVRDAWRAHFERDADAAARLTRFNAQLLDTAHQFAPATRSGFPEVIPPGYRGELMVDAIDKGRPIVSRLDGIPLSDATPFRIPVEGEFSGVGDHVEGTAHVAAGTLTVGEVTVNPKAMSGAFEVSRELVDSSNPAIDRIALNAMLRDYRGATETYAAARLTAGLAPELGVDTGAELEAQLIDFLDDRDASPAFIASGITYYKERATEQAGDGRARYPYLNPSNASGTTTAGFHGLSVQGVELVRAGAMNTAQAALVYPEDVLWGESSVLTFRFDEVQGPGVIKLALFAYVAGQRLRDSGVKVVSSAAAP